MEIGSAHAGENARSARARATIVAEICERVANGEVLGRICEDPDHPEYPARRTFFDWRDDPEIEAAYQKAILIRLDKYVEETIEIADDGANDWMQSTNPQNPGWQLNGEHVQRSKIRISQRNWYAEKIAPRVYGATLAVGGSDRLPPVRQTNVEITPEQAYRTLLTGGTPPPDDGSEFV